MSASKAPIWSRNQPPTQRRYASTYSTPIWAWAMEAADQEWGQTVARDRARRRRRCVLATKVERDDSDNDTEHCGFKRQRKVFLEHRVPTGNLIRVAVRIECGFFDNGREPGLLIRLADLMLFLAGLRSGMWTCAMSAARAS